MTIRFKKKGEFVSRVIAGEILLVPVRGQVGDLNAIYSFTQVGTFLWERIDGHASIDQLVEATVREFEVEYSEAQQDVTEFIASLERAGVIEPVGEEA